MKKLYGVGVNDADYSVTRTIDGKEVWRCPFYKVWADVMKRCLSGRFKSKHPSYEDCVAVPEWLSFLQFKSWMETQDWHGKHLDKDVLLRGNKVYGPETCAFVSPEVNKFILDNSSSRGEYALGVSWHRASGKFISQVCTTKDKVRYLGLYDCPEEAHEAWRKEKHKMAIVLAEKESDIRVKEALRNRYKEAVCQI